MLDSSDHRTTIYARAHAHTTHSVRRDTCARADRRGAGGQVLDDAGNALGGRTAAARADSSGLPPLPQAPPVVREREEREEREGERDRGERERESE